jgi:NAD(P)H-flavin reductase/ferredoxin/fatty-acid desaturase
MAGNALPVRTATINQTPVAVARGQTLLEAALAAGLPVPYGCRVGGCGTCRCRLLQGRVHERSETAYLFDAAELAAGTILACQSEPLTDVVIAVDVDAAVERRQVCGRVVEQTRLAPSITRLVVRLDQGLPYRPGQHALLGLARLPGVVRSYSFAAPPGTEPCVEFHIRHVPGGAFSAAVADGRLVGESVLVDGPLGDFALRAGDDALLFVTTGTGLAPVLAMLEAAAAAGDRRAVTLVHGERSRADLHALPRIDAIARAWRASLRFVPVLSQPDADWRGARGRVVDVIDGLDLPSGPATDAYLCGAPAMVDDAAARLIAQGLPRQRIHADRHVPHAAAAPAAPRRAPAPAQTDRAPPVAEGTVDRDARVGDYLKFFLFHLVGLYAAVALVAGGVWTTVGLLAVVAFYVGGDALLGDDRSAPRYRHPGLLTAPLWAALPLLALIVYAAVWSVSPGDPLGFGAGIHALTGWDALAARAASHFGHQVSAVILTGLMIGMIGTITAHELVHRTWDPVSVAIGRALLAFSFDTVFAIEHVHGHHRYVATPQDPATAPRGRHVYAHILASTWRSNRSAWRIEALRLGRRGLAVLGWRNRVLRGHLASLALVALAYAIGGWAGAGFFVASALVGKALLEIVNYMEHYGLVRDPATPVAARHSWNTNRRISSWSMFNLTRHSHHHAQGEVPYQNLRPLPDAPTMPFGYLTTIIVALIPPLWHRLMAPRLLAWDRVHATAAERRLAAAANRRSGVPALLRQLSDAVGP